MNITTHRFLKLCFCLGGVVYSLSSLAGMGGDGRNFKYSVQHFNTFRKLKFKNEIMVIDRGYFRSGQLVYFARGDSNLIVDIKNSDRKYVLTKKMYGKKLVLNTSFRQGRKPSVSYRIEDDQVHYNSSSPVYPEICKSESLDSLVGKVKISDLNQVDFEVFEKLIDTTSCELNERSRETLTEAISEQFTPRLSNLVRCLSDVDTRGALSKILDGERNAIEILGEYLKEVEGVKNQRAQLKIKCSEVDEAASLQKGPPTQITLPIEDGVLKSPSDNLAHEILHLSGLPERSVLEIEKLCRANFNLKDSELTTKGLDYAVAQELAPTQINETTISNPAVPITEADFAPAPQQAVQALANAPEGSPAFKQGVTTTYNSMDRIFNNMNKIAGQILPSANAAPMVAKSTGHSSSGKKIPIAKAGANDDEIVTEHIELDLNSGNPKTSNTPSAGRAASATSLREDLGGSRANANTNANANASTDLRTNTSTRQSAIRSANRSASPSGSLSEGINPGGSKNSSLKLAPSRNIASSAQESSSTQGASIKQSQSATPTSTQTKPLDVPSAISTLNSFSQLKGDRYQQLKALYSDPAFQKKLETLKISIQVSGSRAPASQGQRRNLGVNSQVAKTVFIDDGNMLRLVKRSIKGE